MLLRKVIDYLKTRLRPMSRAEKEKMLHSHLKDFFAKYGFEHIKLHNQYRKNTAFGYQGVVIALAHYDKEMWMEVSLSVRHDAVEEIAYQFTGGLRNYQNQSHTLIASISKLKNEPYFRFKASTAQEIKSIASQLQEFMLQQGFNFLDSFSELAMVDQSINHAPTKPFPYINNQGNRIIRGLIIAKLVKRTDYPSLQSVYKQQIGALGLGGTYQQKLDRLLAHLEKIAF